MSEKRDNLKRLVEMLQCVTDELDHILEQSDGKGQPAKKKIDPNDSGICEFAEKLRTWNQKKAKIFGVKNGLFSDPCWLMCLDIYTSTTKNQNVSITSVAHGSEIPVTTAIRYLNALTNDGVLKKQTSQNDNRVTFLSLTDDAYEKMTDLLREQLEIYNILTE